MGAAGMVSAGQDRAVIASADPGDTDSSFRRVRTIPPTNGVDDREMIQTVLDDGPGEVVFRSGGNWLIDTTVGTGGIAPRSNTRIIIEDGAELWTKPNANPHGRLIDIGRDGAVQGVTVEGGGSLIGDVLTHVGTDGQWGHLINITQGSADIQIVGPMLLKHAWGDGIYIGGGALNHDVLIDGVIVDDCRREGIAPFWVDGCTIRNCQVLNTGRTMNVAPTGGHGGPGSGIDCEPNSGEFVDHLTVENNRVSGTSGCGIYVAANPGPVTNLVVRNNEVIDCGLTSEVLTTYQVNGIHIAHVDHPVLSDNIVRGSGYDGDPHGTSGQIYLRGANRPVVKGGKILGGRGRGIFVADCDAAELSGIALESNTFHGIVVYRSDRTIVRDNRLLDNVQGSSEAIDHLLVDACNDTVTLRNAFRGDRGYSWLAIKGAGINNVIADNKGSGAPPMNVVVDEGVRTVTAKGGVALG
ncbi:right-handed parallel beta-helix repeat-containing protein [Mycobacterium frederiksbergense]|uniref:right-handed parallel beta-helix repeat-containing protein n=1 Tax=Mycolicibacterium frederiksbergense TaxID=117567 RepID=UPI0021F30AF0|nr:right-handed parallel beta-helix repeat-containing protein [Mycolicibacterium frederiksbergense]MCV7047100.1 right-handed parallel beta-helix repeat-containing protein [Mycolicibacterium frederiksbergense]